ncbi:MAG: hypothetical protein KA368_13985 [Acidobacteria bacterium]|nr:hypothetical protein [Acidobacteriota bacterium]
MFVIFVRKHRQLSRLIPILILGCLVSITLLNRLQPATADTLAAGLRGEYFDNEDFTNLKLTRTDSTIDFNWVFASPDPTINSDNFSIRWTGQLIAPATGNYVLVTQSDDGVRLWIGSQLLIDNLTPHPLSEDRSIAVSLTGGQSYNLRLEYFELTANAVVRLMWIRPGQTAPEIIPSANLATPVNANLAPTLAGLSPNIIPLGTANATVTINGGNFLQGAVAQINNSARTTTFVSSTQLTAVLTASDLAIATQFKITAVNPLPGGGTSNPLTLTVSGGFEADVAPRPNGTNNGTITIADWTQLGRFAAGLDVVNTGNEYQRADCAPRSSMGDGKITLTDWVQAGRYAAAIDPPTGAGGPIAPITNLNQPSEDGSGVGSWELEVGTFQVLPYRQLAASRQPELYAEIYAVTKTPNSVAIFCDCGGIENAIGFSFRFNSENWELASSSTGRDSQEATLLVNAQQALSGFIGMALALPPNRHFGMGHRQVAVLTFRQRLGNIAPLFSNLEIEFADQPIAREVVSAKAKSLRAIFASGSQTPVVARLASAQTRRR